MALLKYLPPGIISNSADLKPCQKLSEAAGDKTKKWASYSKISPKDRAVVGKHSSENGVPKTLQY